MSSLPSPRGLLRDFLGSKSPRNRDRRASSGSRVFSPRIRVSQSNSSNSSTKNRTTDNSGSSDEDLTESMLSDLQREIAEVLHCNKFSPYHSSEEIPYALLDVFKLANEENCDARFEMACTYHLPLAPIDEQDYLGALYWYLLATLNRDSRAMNNIAALLLDAHKKKVVQISPGSRNLIDISIDWLKIAIKFGQLRSISNLGTLLLFLERYDEAMDLYNLEDPKSGTTLNNLGVMHCMGKGTCVNYAMGRECFIIAEQAGVVEARRNLDMINGERVDSISSNIMRFQLMDVSQSPLEISVNYNSDSPKNGGRSSPRRKQRGTRKSLQTRPSNESTTLSNSVTLTSSNGSSNDSSSRLTQNADKSPNVMEYAVVLDLSICLPNPRHPKPINDKNLHTLSEEEE